MSNYPKCPVCGKVDDWPHGTDCPNFGQVGPAWDTGQVMLALRLVAREAELTVMQQKRDEALAILRDSRQFIDHSEGCPNWGGENEPCSCGIAEHRRRIKVQLREVDAAGHPYGMLPNAKQRNTIRSKSFRDQRDTARLALLTSEVEQGRLRQVLKQIAEWPTHGKHKSDCACVVAREALGSIDLCKTCGGTGLGGPTAEGGRINREPCPACDGNGKRRGYEDARTALIARLNGSWESGRFWAEDPYPEKYPAMRDHDSATNADAFLAGLPLIVSQEKEDA